MSDPITYQATSTRFGLPFLFAAQSQREFFVNEALARIDCALHPVIDGELAAPPANPGEGAVWLVAPGATGAWAGHDGDLAAFDAGAWTFVAPQPGMRAWERVAARAMVFSNGVWLRPEPPADPVGGTSIDTEARAAIINLIASLRHAGIFSAA